jgi:hypothetical protein
MIEIQLSKYRKARIWINEFPNACFDSAIKLEKTYPNNNIDIQNLANGSFTVEVNIPVGARIIYGLLGAEFYPDSLNSFSLEIYSSDSTKVSFDNSIYQGTDNLFVGLPLIYSNAVKRGFLQYFKDTDKAKPNGKLVFKCAAHSEVGSSEDIFEKLAIIISQYFFSREKYETDEDYFNLFSKIK